METLGRAGYFFGLPTVTALSVLFFACADSGRSGFTETTAPTDDAAAAPPPEPSFGEDGGIDAGGANGCSEEAKLVYVLSLEGDLYSFAPADKEFTKIGPLNCKQDGLTFEPVSMAVDHDAVAWVNMRADMGFGEGVDALFKVDTKTAKCEPSGIEGGLGTMGGMGFSANDKEAADETLFIDAFDPDSEERMLQKVDFVKKKLVPVTVLDTPGGLELTGTGDGRLYGFLVNKPLQVAQMSKTTAALSKAVTLDGVTAPVAPMYAFSFWGGDFFFYTASDTSPSKTSSVARYSPTTDQIDPAYMEQIGFHIVGAGVSTCAPTVAPK